jgi:hypothetical protein
LKTESERQQLLKGALSLAKKVVPPMTPHKRSCFYQSIAAWTILRMYSQFDKDLDKLHIVAGTAQFQMVPDELDDGVSPTHYSYIYDDEVAAPLWARNQLPECHCWVQFVYAGEVWVCDLTTKYLPELTKMIGKEWQTPPPPDELLTKVTELPKGWVYRPDAGATTRLTEHVIRWMQQNPINRYLPPALRNV